MLLNITLSADAIYPALMLVIAIASFMLNIYLTRRSNSRFKQEEMGKKLDAKVFKEYKDDHEKDHDILEKHITHHFDTRFNDFKDFIKEMNNQNKNK